jgi:outer membrane protein assembly factor BamB
MLLGAAGCLAAAPAAADWPGFRGPHELGISTDRGLPVTWAAGDNVAWKAPLPGPGSSSPITHGGRVFVTCYAGYGTGKPGDDDPKNLRRIVLAFDRKGGKLLWQKDVPAKQPVTRYKGFITQHGYASSTPATDGERLYVFFGTSGVFAYDFDGKELWHADVGSKIHQWSSASSPTLYKDLVLLNAGVESGALVALDKNTGKEVWRTPGIRQSWCTPVLVEVPGAKTEVVMNLPGSVVGYDPDTGKELWRCQGIDDGYVCPSAVAKDGIVYVIGGRRKIRSLAVKAGGRGDVTESHRLWTQKAGANVPSAVLYEGHLYWVNDQGQANCLKADNGAIVYQERLQGKGQAYASPVEADSRLYVVTRQGGTYVLAARPKFAQLAHDQFADDTSICNASPAVDHGQLLLRSGQYLYCIAKK